MIVSPNYRFLVKPKNDSSFDMNQAPEKKVKTRRLIILNEFRKKVLFLNACLIYEIPFILFLLGRKLEHPICQF